MLTLPDLNRLKVFYAVYTSTSLVEAARVLHITRSAVSQSIKALEEEMGVSLFMRSSKSLLATEAANILFHAIAPLLTELQSTVHQIEQGKKSLVGHLRVGAPQDFGSMHLSKSIVAFQHKYPQLSFELVLGIPTLLLEQLSAGKLDMAFVDNGDMHAKNYPVSCLTVMEERFILVCAKKYFDQQVKQDSLLLKNVSTLAFIDYVSTAPVTRMWLQHQFGARPMNLRVVFSAENVRALITATLGGLGLCVLPERLILSELKLGKLKRIETGKRDFINKISLVRRLGQNKTARAEHFVQFYQSQFAAKL